MRMKPMQLRALLIGENAQGSLNLIKRLEGYRCECRFVTSYQEARSLLKFQRFDLVLSPMRLRGSSLFPLVNQLEGSQITLFYFQAVEEGCWWLPALRSGRNCFGSCALRPSEFIVSLGQIMDEIQVGPPSLAEHKAPVASARQTSIATLSWSHTISVVATPVRAKDAEILKRCAAG
jgi:hypothetical protein